VAHTESFELHGVPISVENTRPDIATADVIARLDEALGLIEKYQPWRLQHLRRDLDVISNELNLRLDLEPGAETSSPAAMSAPDGESHDGAQDVPEQETLIEVRSAERE
jgi:hypothetical protein